MGSHVTLSDITECTTIVRAVDIVIHSIHWMMLQNMYLKFLLLDKTLIAGRAFVW
jgi:hypothetical protein